MLAFVHHPYGRQDVFFLTFVELIVNMPRINTSSCFKKRAIPTAALVPPCKPHPHSRWRPGWRAGMRLFVEAGINHRLPRHRS